MSEGALKRLHDLLTEEGEGGGAPAGSAGDLGHLPTPKVGLVEPPKVKVRVRRAVAKMGKDGKTRYVPVDSGFDLPPASEKAEDTFTREMAAETLKELGAEFGFAPADFDMEEFTMGMNVELEHSDITKGDPHLTGRIALVHLREDGKYYSKLKTLKL